MSWDLYLVPPEHAEAAGEWIESRVIEEIAGDPATAQEHARLILARRPELVATDPDDDGTIEVSVRDPETGPPVTILLDGVHAEVNAAYWDLGREVGETATLIVDVVSTLTAHTGWIAFDPQRDEVVGMDELADVFLREHSEGTELAAEIRLEESQPRKKRFFGLFGD